VPSRPLHLDLYWQALLQPPADYAEFAQLLSPGGAVIAAAETVPGRGSFPTSEWTSGRIYRDTLSLYPRAELTAPVAARLVLGWRPERQPPGFPMQVRAAKRSSQVEVGRLRLAPSHPAALNPSHSLAANFGDQVDLLGYDRAAETLTLYWRPRAAIPEDYTVFVHVLDAGGRLIAQSDNQPRQGNYPTPFWLPGEVIQDEHRLSIPANAAQIIVGLYQLQSGRRVPVVGQAADSVSLQ
jgi:hypothetical protein